MVKIETTEVYCGSCTETIRVCGKSGTSIPYMEYCPCCGSGDVYTRPDIIDTSDPDMDYYSDEANVGTD